MTVPPALLFPSCLLFLQSPSMRSFHSVPRANTSALASASAPIWQNSRKCKSASGAQKARHLPGLFHICKGGDDGLQNDQILGEVVE